MSSNVKAEGTTTRLLQAAQAAVKGNVAEYKRVLNLIKTSHAVAIHEAMGSSDASAQLQDEISDDLDSLRKFLDAIEVRRRIRLCLRGFDMKPVSTL